MVKIANGASWSTPATIDDPEVLNEIEIKLKEIGYGQQKKET